MGGDHGPQITVPALALAARKLGPDARFIVHGDEAQITAALAGQSRSLAGQVEIRHTDKVIALSLIHISEPTRLLSISYAVFCLKKKTHI